MLLYWLFISSTIFISREFYFLFFYTLKKWTYVSHFYSPLQRQVKHCFLDWDTFCTRSSNFMLTKRRVAFDQRERRLNSKPRYWPRFYILWQALRWCMVGWLNNATLRMRTGVDDSELYANKNNCRG